MSPQQIDTIKRTWLQVSSMDPVLVGTLFYSRFLDTAPELKRFFTTPVAEQSRKFILLVSNVISRLEFHEEIRQTATRIAMRYTNHGIKEEHFTLAGRALLSTLQNTLGTQWNDSIKEAWAAAYTQVAAPMKAITCHKLQVA